MINKVENRMQILKNYSLKRRNTFKIDVKADRFISFDNIQSIQKYLTGNERADKFMILGEGSNVLFTKNFNGDILSIDLKGMHIRENTEEYVIMEVGAGENWHNFVETCVRNSYYGVENLALIPGRVGAAPVQNIGAYGVEQSDMFASLKAIDIETGELVEFNKEECKFSYRDSIFKSSNKNKYIIVSVLYKLFRHKEFNLSYKALADEIKKFFIEDPDLEYIFNSVIRIRKIKLPDPNELGNAGSFFKNPIIEKVQYEKLKQIYHDIPAHDFEGKIKTSAAWLIEKCGWKSKIHGGAGVSEKHSLVLVNVGFATGQELFELSEKIIKSVFDKFGITLEREVTVIS